MAKAIRNELNDRPVVVLVDDDVAVLSSLKFALEVEGFVVAAYCSAEDLLSDSLVGRAGCFVLDHHLPGASGLDIVTSLRKLGFSTPVILITSNPTQLLVNRARQEGAAIIEKPLLGNSLIDAIRASVTPQKPLS